MADNGQPQRITIEDVADDVEEPPWPLNMAIDRPLPEPTTLFSKEHLMWGRNEPGGRLPCWSEPNTDKAASTVMAMTSKRSPDIPTNRRQVSWMPMSEGCRENIRKQFGRPSSPDKSRNTRATSPTNQKMLEPRRALLPKHALTDGQEPQETRVAGMATRCNVVASWTGRAMCLDAANVPGSHERPQAHLWNGACLEI